MSHRTALLLGLDDSPTTTGARADVVDLAQMLMRQGLSATDVLVLTARPLGDALPELHADHKRIATAATIDEALAWVNGRLGGDDDTALVHVSGRGTTTIGEGHGVVLPGDSVLPVTSLLASFADHPVRSVLTVLDVGFAGDPATTRTIGAELPMADLALASGDPVITANGGQGPVAEHEIAGAMRGPLSWALGRAVQMLRPGQDWQFTHLMQALAEVHRIGGVDQRPGLSPAGASERGLGAFIDGGQAHVPWRGVSAHFQLGPAFGQIIPIGGPPSIGDFETTAPNETWVWSNPANQWPAGGFSVPVQASGNPGPGTTYAFTNNGFSGPPTSTAPTVAPTDRVYRVQVPRAAPDQVVLIARIDANGNPTAMEWFTTSTQQFLPVQPGDVLGFTQHTIDPAVWGASSWYRAYET